MTRLPIVLLLVVSLSGCGQPEDPAVLDPTACVDIYCMTEVTSPVADALAARYGAITYQMDPKVHSFAYRLEGDLLIWQQERTNENHTAFRNDLLGFDIQRKVLRGISVGLDNHTTRFAGHDGRVFFDETSHVGEPDGYVSAWDAATGHAERLNLPIDGILSPKGFDGRWLILEQMGPASREFAVWAVDWPSLDQVKLYPSPLFTTSFVNGTRALWTSALDDGTVYLAISDYAPKRGKPIHFRMEIWATEIATNTTRLVARQEHQIEHMDADGGRLVWMSSPGFTAFQMYLVNQIGDEPLLLPGTAKTASYPRMAGDWVLYRGDLEGEVNGGLIGYHIPTATAQILLPGSPDYLIRQYDTNGVDLVVSLYPLTPGAFPEQELHLVVMKLPTSVDAPPA